MKRIDCAQGSEIAIAIATAVISQLAATRMVDSHCGVWLSLHGLPTVNKPPFFELLFFVWSCHTGIACIESYIVV
jgi:hypothetical protein